MQALDLTNLFLPRGAMKKAVFLLVSLEVYYDLNHFLR
jgi:hypothetical protein